MAIQSLSLLCVAFTYLLLYLDCCVFAEKAGNRLFSLFLQNCIDEDKGVAYLLYLCDDDDDDDDDDDRVFILNHGESPPWFCFVSVGEHVTHAAPEAGPFLDVCLREQLQTATLLGGEGRALLQQPHLLLCQGAATEGPGGHTGR